MTHASPDRTQGACSHARRAPSGGSRYQGNAKEAEPLLDGTFHKGGCRASLYIEAGDGITLSSRCGLARAPLQSQPMTARQATAVRSCAYRVSDGEQPAI
jgi:hypothetical protein